MGKPGSFLFLRFSELRRTIVLMIRPGSRRSPLSVMPSMSLAMLDCMQCYVSFLCCKWCFVFVRLQVVTVGDL